MIVLVIVTQHQSKLVDYKLIKVIRSYSPPIINL